MSSNSNPAGSNSKLSANDDMPVEYRHSGTSGHASSTISGKSSALVHFNDFLVTKKMKSFEELSEQSLCSIALFQQFGTYISEYAKQKRKVMLSTSNLLLAP